MPRRPLLHFTPFSNWMNDPNGLVFYAGEYHLFYQHHPHSNVWGPMHWGHAVSRDLFHWEHLPVALYPDDFGMVFSGSAVVDWHNTAGFGVEALVAIFTYNKNHYETQNLAYSTDRGRTWVKYPGNPVLVPPDDLVNFRDPKVFWHTDHWVMALAAGDHIRFYTSPDLKDWTHSGSFGADSGSHGGVWETPDLFQLPVAGSHETRWVLTLGVGDGSTAGGSGTQYFVGHFDGQTFTSENPPETVLWMDYGADFYAPQSWSDEPRQHRILLAWMSNWKYANLTPADNWRGTFTLPREISLVQTGQGIRLAQEPVDVLAQQRKCIFQCKDLILFPEDDLLADVRATCFEIDAEIGLDSVVGRFGFRVCVGSGHRTTLLCHPLDQIIQLDRTESGQVDFHDGFPAVHTAPFPASGEVLHLRIFVDSHSVEVFAGDGLVTLTDNIFPLPGCDRMSIFTEGGPLALRSLSVYEFHA